MITDTNLQRDVSDELHWDAGIDAPGLSVAAKAGIVTITGNVKYYSQQNEVERLAESINGVREVIMRVAVVPTEFPSDGALTNAAAAALAATAELGENPIEVRVANAWITLTGSVSWNFQRFNAETAVGALRGVRGISNDITISTPPAPAGEIKTQIEAALKRLFDAEHQSVGVAVSDGEVTLTGHVTSGWQRNLVRRSAWNARGVRGVRDELTLDY